MPYDLNNPTRLAAVKIHGLLNQAAEASTDKKVAAYYIVFKALLYARKNDVLREDVRKRFSEECPKVGSKQFNVLHTRFQKEIEGTEAKIDRRPIRKGRVQTGDAGMHASA